MTSRDSNEHLERVRDMFARISLRYDLLNRLMTFGRDKSWRKEAISKLEVKQGQIILDAGSGTGDIALEILQRVPDVMVVAADLTIEMIEVGKHRSGGERIHWVVADAQSLPFGNSIFNGVISGYLLRNVPNVDITLKEQYRVAVPGAHFVSLDTTPPRKNLLYPFINFYLKVVIPTLGKWITGDKAAYTYLPETTRHFLTAEELANRISGAGFKNINFVRRMMGSMAIHRAIKN